MNVSRLPATARKVVAAGTVAGALAVPVLLAPPGVPAHTSGGSVPGGPLGRLSADSLLPPADHHMHVWSPDAVDALLQAQEAIGEEVIPPDRARPLGAENVLAALDSAGIRRGVILSTAYFFGFPDLEFADEEARVRAENDYVARQAAGHPDRLTAFFSVNPLADYAMHEIERCAEKPELTGLKLHLGNSRVAFADPAHVRRLRDVFLRSNRLGLPIVIHLKNPEAEYGRAAVETFVEEVLSAAPDVPVQVAHLAGDGAWDEATREAVDAFAAAIEERPELTRRLFFDFSATPIPTALAQGDSALLTRVRTMNEGVLAALRKLGSERLVYGTDWPAVSAPLYLEIRNSLEVDEAELAALMKGAAPYLR